MKVLFKPFIDAYGRPYKEKYIFLDCFRDNNMTFITAIFLYSSGTEPQVNNYIIVGVSFTVYIAVKGIYKYKTLSTLEIFQIRS